MFGPVVLTKGLKFALLNVLTLCVCRAGGPVQAPEGSGRLAEVRRLLEAGDWKRADELATSLASQSNASYEVYELLGRARDAQRRYEDADAAYRRAIQLAPNAASPHVSLGVSYVQRGQAERALEQFQQALARDPRNLVALSNAGSLELAAKHFAEAETYYQSAQQIAPSDPLVLLGLATAALGAGHREPARNTASLLAATANPAVHFSLGLLYAKNALYAEAAGEFEAVVRKGVRSPELFLNLGRVYSEQKKYDAAKISYFKAIDLNPDDAAPYVRVGADYLAQQKSTLALVWLFRALRLDRGQPETLYLLGHALMDGEYFDTAHRYLDQYVRLRPGDPKGWLLLGDAFLKDEQLENALQSYQKASALVPELAAAHYLVGNAAYLTKRTPEAKRELLRALTIDPSHAEAQLRLGEIAYRENKNDEAAARFQAVLSAHPDDVEAAYDLAKVRVRQEQFVPARGLLEKIVARRRDDIRFHYLLGQVYRELNVGDLSARESALYRTIKAEQEYEHRFIRHSHAYVE
jgi:tetratricopeptide (TPR) repeat protein